MAEALMICVIYITPFIVAITVGAFIFETVIPAILRKRARRRRDELLRTQRPE